MSKTFSIIGVGSPLVDSLAHVNDAHIESIQGAKGGMELVDSTQMEALTNDVRAQLIEAPGGSAGNTIFALSRLGMKNTFLGKIGNDAGATFFKEAYEKIGGDSSRLKAGELANGRCLSLITPDSERTMRTDLGASMTLHPDEIQSTDFEDCQHAHIEGYLLFNRDLMYKVLDAAKEAGCTVSIDLASFEVVNAAKDILPEILEKYIDVVFANEEEADAFTDKHKGQYDAIAKELARFSKVGVVKLGKKGSIICEGDSLHTIDPILVDAPKDTTAAGDFWAAGFLYGWLNNKPHKASGTYGSILGAEVVQVIGSVLEDHSWASIQKQLTQ